VIRALLRALLLAAIVLAPSVLGAQARRDSTARRDSLLRDSLARRDTTTRIDALGRRVDAQGRPIGPGADTVKRELVTWDPADSVMAELMARTGMIVTRYKGDRVIFRADQRTIFLVGKPSAVQRDQTLLVGDTIEFNDSTQVAIARGDTLVLRDPSQGQDDIRVSGLLRYDIRNQTGLATKVNTAVESGQRWIVHGEVAAFANDTSAKEEQKFYARSGWLTSCEETEPHYHFAAKEMKVIKKNVLVARPAILYIKDVPVFWLPFIFQDLRTGRRSGLIAPRFGITDIVRNSPTYRRTIDDFGYYFALSDYFDAEVTMDWRSSAGSTTTDPGWIRLNSLVRYAWLDRFVTGQFAAARMSLSDGSRNLSLTLNHAQDFSARSKLTASLNYVTNTTVQRQTTFNPYSALQTINSSLNFTQQFGRGMSLALGGTQKQYPGRDQLDRDFPSVNFTSQPIKLASWATWTPGFNFANQQSFDIDQPGQFSFVYRVNPAGGVDSTAVKRSTRNTSFAMTTPFKFFEFNWNNSIRVIDNEFDFPEQRIIVDPTDSTKRSTRVFARTFQTGIDWDTGINLPSAFQGSWNLTPSVSFANVDPGPMFVRNERTGGKFASQSKRAQFGLAISPTFFGLFPGIGPITRLRHAISPSLSFDYAPRGHVSDEFLAATGRTRQGYLGALQRNQFNLGLSTNIEAKLRSKGSDTASTSGLPDEGRKVKLLSLQFTPLNYDLQRKRAGAKSGFTTSRFGWTARSDLLPGLDIGVDYSLFQGDVLSDTAIFKPFRESVRASVSLNKTSGIVVALGRLFGKDFSQEAQQTDPQAAGISPDAQFRQQQSVATQSLSGAAGRASLFQVPSGQGWQASLNFTSTRQRPVRGGTVITRDPAIECLPFRNNVFVYDQCVREHALQPPTNDNPFGTPTPGGPIFVGPPQTNVQGSMSFNITQKWAAQWQTTYDFESGDFASQIVSLQRELHDWNAIFAFTQSPNGNFSFNFFIALKAQPDLKFNYDRRSFRRGTTTTP
jgi:hypothetical protein